VVERPVLLPPCIPNEADELWKFNDSVSHESCFTVDPAAQRAKARFEELYAKNGPGMHRCTVCKQDITDVNEYITMGYLGEATSDPLHMWNYAQFHKRCLGRWPELGSVIAMAEERLRSGWWKGKALLGLVQRLKELQ